MTLAAAGKPWGAVFVFSVAEVGNCNSVSDSWVISVPSRSSRGVDRVDCKTPRCRAHGRSRIPMGFTMHSTGP